MYSTRQHNKDSAEVLRLREECGVWLRQKREAAGISQRELARQLGFDYYSFISQIESGKGRVPTDQIAAWAKLVNVEPRAFAQTMLKYYDPINHQLLFGDDEASRLGPADSAAQRDDESGLSHSSNVLPLDERIERLERKTLEDRVARLEALLTK